MGARPGSALHVTDVYGNSLERTFLATSPPAPSAPSRLCSAALHPFLGHLTAAPLHLYFRKFAFPPLLEMEIFSGPLAGGAWGPKSRELPRVPSKQAMAKGSRLCSRLVQSIRRGGRIPRGGVLKGWTPAWGEHRGHGFGLAPESPRRPSRVFLQLIKTRSKS